jgi:predicted molibdopterin-dependent oxidoreductase YjgC
MASCARERICNPTSARRRAAPQLALAQGMLARNSPRTAERRGIRDGDRVSARLASRSGERAPRAQVTSGGAGRGLHDVPSPDTRANVITTDYSDWATNCPNTRSPPCRSRRRTVRHAGRRTMESSAARAAAFASVEAAE